MRKILAVLTALSAFVVLATPAGAATDRGRARAVGDGLVARLMGEGAPCAVVTKQRFFGHGNSYLASCASKDRSFRFVVVVPVKPGGLTVDVPYIRARIDEVCTDTGGVVYSAGVKERFAAVYLGRGSDIEDGTGASVAVGLWNGLTGQLATTPGAFHTGETCAGGAVTQKVA